MAVVERKPKHRIWVREVLMGIAVSVGSNLLWMLVQAAVHRLG
ncbi:DUF6408 family protein [Streptomyces sp. NPDC093221]